MQEALRTAVCGFEERPQIPLQLEKEGRIKEVFRLSHNVGLASYGITVSDLIFDTGERPLRQYEMPVADFKKFQEKYFMQFMANMCRIDSYTGKHTDFAEAVCIFRGIVSFLYDAILRHSVQLVLIAHIPHEVADVILEQLAHFIDIKVRLVVTPSYINNGFFCLERNEDFGIYKYKENLRKSVPTSLDYFIIDSDPVRSQWVVHNKNIRIEKFESQVLHSNGIGYNFPLHEQYLVDIERISQTQAFPKKFIYFPLHYQPESATMGMADVFYDDQALCIEALAGVLPDDFYILVKEQPGQTFYYRSASFFNRLRAMPQVRFVRRETSSAELLQHARAAATVTGTVGWEALRAGKPVIYFGRPVYRELPGAFGFSDELDMNQVLTYAVNKKDVEIALGDLLSTLYLGCLGELSCDLAPQKADVLGARGTEEENIKQCVESIGEILCKLEESDPNYIEKHAQKIAALQEKSYIRPVVLSEHLPQPPEPVSVSFIRAYPRWKRKTYRYFKKFEKFVYSRIATRP